MGYPTEWLPTISKAESLAERVNVPIPNKILPPEKLSNREIVLRVIHSFNGEPFTIDALRKKTKNTHKLKATVVRYHLEDLHNNLYLRKLPRESRTPIQYQWHDGIKDVYEGLADESTGWDYLNELERIVQHVRQGNVIHPDVLTNLRNSLGAHIDELQKEADKLAILYDCDELWRERTLVTRLGYRDGRPQLPTE